MERYQLSKTANIKNNKNKNKETVVFFDYLKADGTVVDKYLHKFKCS